VSHDALRALPPVDALAAEVDAPRAVAVAAARAVLAARRTELLAGADGEADLVARAREWVARPGLRRVINATGVIVHTNLGRAPLAQAALERVSAIAGSYSTLEYDIERGARGRRDVHAEALLSRLTGAEAAIVVNNNAAATLLILAALADGREVIVSRGELVEIGGGFRIPKVLRASGADLVEVGTTNRTRLADYEGVAADVALVLKVHPSNYRLTGFTETVEVAALEDLGPPVVADLGSGLLDAAAPWLPGGPPAWLAGEPAARQTLAAGADLVTFSCDKLLGGPQAGVIAGRADLVERCARHPLARALRPGGLVVSALTETALAYLRRDGDAIPFWRMATTPVEALRARAEALGVGRVVDCASVTGGGTLPGVELPSAGVAVDGDVTTELRSAEPPIIARVVDGATVCDLRTVHPDDDGALAGALG
jgi:L-seryl-tRNA(Ser) seleniumtransferase